MKKLCYFLVFSGYDMISQYAFAAEEITTPNFFSMLIRMFSVLAFILGIMLVALYFIKKMGFKSGVLPGTQKCMEIVERLYLGPKKSIALLKVGKEFVLIGLSSNQITFLSKVDVSRESDTDNTEIQNEDFYRLLSRVGDRHEKENSLPSLFSPGPRKNHAKKLFKRILNQIVLPQKGNKVAKRRA